MDLELLAKAIREKRLALGLSKADLEKLSGVSRHTIKKYEEGKTEPGVVKFLALCLALDIDMSILDKAAENIERPKSLTMEERLARLEKRIALLGEAKRALVTC